MTFAETCRHFQSKRIGKGKHIALCPHHRDRKASLSIREGHSTALVKCMSQGCSLADICKSSGIRIGDLYYEQVESPAAVRKAQRARDQAEAVEDLVRECRRTLIYRRQQWSKAATALAWLVFQNPSNIGLAAAYELALDSCGQELGQWHRKEPPYSPFPSHKLLHGLSTKDFPPHIAKLLKLKP